MFDGTSILIGISALLLSAILSGLEAAYLSADKLLIQIDSEKETLRSRCMKFILNNQFHVLGSLLIGVTLLLLVYSSVFSSITSYYFPILLPKTLQGNYINLFIDTLMLTLITLIFAEFIPKSIFMLYPNSFLNFFCYPLTAICIIFYPLVTFVIFISNFVSRYVFRQNITDYKHEFELKDVQSFLKKSLKSSGEQTTTSFLARIASNVIEFKKITLRNCMVPRIEIKGIDISSSIDALKDAFSEHGHSRIIVYNGDIDNIIGYCQIKDLLNQPKTISDIVIDIMINTESMMATDLLNIFMNKKQDISLIVDEYGGTAGIVTKEDIIEKIFGEIQDEHYTDFFVEEVISTNEFIFSARLEIDYLNDKYTLDLPKGNDYDTLGGLILSHFGKLPKTDDLINIDNYSIKVLSMKNTRIDKVHIKVK